MESMEEKAELEQANEIVGVSPKTVKVYGLALSGFLVPLFGIVPSIAALVKGKKAKQEILSSGGKLSGLDLYKKSLVYAWLGVASFIFHVGLIAFLVWLITIIPSLMTSPQVQELIQDNVSSIVADVPVTIDLKALGFSDEEVQTLKDVLPDGVDINNLTLEDILNLADEYGIN